MEETRGAALAALEHDHAQGRRQGQGHHARNHHGNRDGDRELAVKLSRQATQKGYRNEDRAQHQDDGNHRPGHLLHCLDRRLARRKALFMHDALDVLQHHDGVIHHDADRQHHAKKRQRVDRVSQ